LAAIKRRQRARRRQLTITAAQESVKGTSWRAASFHLANNGVALKLAAAHADGPKVCASSYGGTPGPTAGIFLAPIFFAALVHINIHRISTPRLPRGGQSHHVEQWRRLS